MNNAQRTPEASAPGVRFVFHTLTPFVWKISLYARCSGAAAHPFCPKTFTSPGPDLIMEEDFPARGQLCPRVLK